jgi:hypothetical protein
MTRLGASLADTSVAPKLAQPLCLTVNVRGLHHGAAARLRRDGGMSPTNGAVTTLSVWPRLAFWALHDDDAAGNRGNLFEG